MTGIREMKVGRVGDDFIGLIQDDSDEWLFVRVEIEPMHRRDEACDILRRIITLIQDEAEDEKYAEGCGD